LSVQRNPIEVLGTDDLTTIPYAQIHGISSRNTDNDVEVRYKAKKEIEDKSLFFDSVDDKLDFVASLDSVLPDHLQKSETQQSVISASLNPLLSLVLSVAATYLFIDKLRWPTIIVGGIWSLGSLYMLISRAKAPPRVTRWTIKGRYVRKLWSGLKTAFGYAVLAAIIAIAHGSLPDSHGPSSIYEQLQFETLSAKSVATLVERGADVDYVGEYGETPLSIALDWSEDDIAIALIEAGADLTSKNDYDETPVEHVVYYGMSAAILEAMLKHGASLEFLIDDQTPLEYVIESDYMELAAVIQKYTDKQ